MKYRYLFIKYALGLGGLFLMAFGVTFSIRSGLGTSPLSALPYILSSHFPISMGEFVFLMHFFYLGLQIALLGRRFPPIQLLQLPLGMAFGLFTDITMNCFAHLAPAGISWQLLCLLLGCCILGAGISLLVNSGIIMIAAQAFVAVIARKYGKKFGNVKIAVDCTAVCIGLLLSCCFFGTLFEHGIGLGTLISALLVGNVVKLADRAVKPLTLRLCGGKPLPSDAA